MFRHCNDSSAHLRQLIVGFSCWMHYFLTVDFFFIKFITAILLVGHFEQPVCLSIQLTVHDPRPWTIFESGGGSDWGDGFGNFVRKMGHLF